MAGPSRAVLAAVGDELEGQQPAGVVAGYELEATGDANYGDITPYDSGDILGTVPPGKDGIKLTDGTQQRASQIICTTAADTVGNALVSVTGVGLIPSPPTGSQPEDGLSQAPNRE